MTRALSNLCWGSTTRCAALGLLALALLAGSGCASTCWTCAPSLDTELATRTGTGLGPAFCPGEITLPEDVSLDRGITEEEAAVIGLWNNPGYRELLADLLITQADVIQASQLSNPQLTNLLPVGTKDWEMWLILPVDVMALRPARVRAAQLENERVSERLAQDGLNVVRDVRSAYVDVRLAQSQAELARLAADDFRELARIGSERLKAGAIAETEIAPLQIEAHTTRERAQRAGIEVDVVRERLTNLLGLSRAGVKVQLASTATPAVIVAHPQPDADQLVAEALAGRPDLLAVEAAIVAADQRHSLTWWDYLGVNMYLPDANANGVKGFEAGPGIQLFLPILHQNQGMKARTAAEVERLMRQQVRLQDTAAFEVRQALLRIEQARQSHMLWKEDVLPRAAAAAQSARDALKEDGASLFVVVDTARQLIFARQRVIETQAELDRATIELERSVGRRMPRSEPGEPLPPQPVVPEEIQP